MSRLIPTLTAVRGEGLELGAFEDRDEPQLAHAFADPEIARWNPGPAEAAAVTEWWQRRNDWTTGEHASWAIRAVDGELLGSVSLHRIDQEQSDAEVGYWVLPDKRGQGVASVAVQLATDFAFSDLELHRVYLFHAVANAPSCAVAEHAGFRLEGRLVQSHRYADGRYHDEHLHARLMTELTDVSRMS